MTDDWDFVFVTEMSIFYVMDIDLYVLQSSLFCRIRHNCPINLRGIGYFIFCFFAFSAKEGSLGSLWMVSLSFCLGLLGQQVIDCVSDNPINIVEVFSCVKDAKDIDWSPRINLTVYSGILDSILYLGCGRGGKKQRMMLHGTDTFVVLSSFLDST